MSRLKKEKEKIRNQIIKSLEAYKGKSGFIFFDLPDSKVQSTDTKLDNNDLEVLQMNLGGSNWILLTTKSLIISQSGIINRINGLEIDECEFVNLENGLSKEKAVEFETTGGYKSWLHSGDFKVIKKDNTSVLVSLPHHDFGFCLLKAIKKLCFVMNKYNGI